MCRKESKNKFGESDQPRVLAFQKTFLIQLITQNSIIGNCLKCMKWSTKLSKRLILIHSIRVNRSRGDMFYVHIEIPRQSFAQSLSRFLSLSLSTY